MKLEKEKKKQKQILSFLLLFFILIWVPILVQAQGQIIPDCGKEINGQFVECGYGHLLQLVNNIINWIILISVPIAAGVFAFVGIRYMTTSIIEQKTEAKNMLWKVFWGFVAILSAWIIVTTITKALLNEEFIKEVPVEGVNEQKNEE